MAKCDCQWTRRRLSGQEILPINRQVSWFQLTWTCWPLQKSHLYIIEFWTVARHVMLKKERFYVHIITLNQPAFKDVSHVFFIKILFVESKIATNSAVLATALIFCDSWLFFGCFWSFSSFWNNLPLFSLQCFQIHRNFQIATNRAVLATALIFWDSWRNSVTSPTVSICLSMNMGVSKGTTRLESKNGMVW